MASARPATSTIVSHRDSEPMHHAASAQRYPSPPDSDPEHHTSSEDGTCTDLHSKMLSSNPGTGTAEDMTRASSTEPSAPSSQQELDGLPTELELLSLSIRTDNTCTTKKTIAAEKPATTDNPSTENEPSTAHGTPGTTGSESRSLSTTVPTGREAYVPSHRRRKDRNKQRSEPSTPNFAGQPQLRTRATNAGPPLPNAGAPSLKPPAVSQQKAKLVNTSSDPIRVGIDGTARHPKVDKGEVNVIVAGQKSTRHQSERQKHLHTLAGASIVESERSIHPHFYNRDTKRIHVMERPTPTWSYLNNASLQPQTLDFSRPLFVILDLNGTLLYRDRKHIGRSNAFVARPHVDAFLDYLFSEHRVMVWSSAKPQNVAKMCADLFTVQQRQQIVAIWARDKLNLTPDAYNQKVQVYKQLSWVWNDPAIQRDCISDQSNTVLIDDSLEKAASEPYNLIQLDEFEGNMEQLATDDVLHRLILYLVTLRSQRDVSAYIHNHPFERIQVSREAMRKQQNMLNM